MDIDSARYWLIRVSLIITGSNFIFFLLSPAIGYPLTFQQAVRLLEISLPVFLGYLGTATYFLFQPELSAKRKLVSEKKAKLLKLLVVGPVTIFGLTCLTAIIAFGISNGVHATPGTGMNVDLLAGAISGALGILAATTNLIVSYLFALEK